ncbi:serine protease grass isoform X1 [Drosophila subpulchrella]|uniref:serine protease grass isoform X1 n=1 Tax=Drosophila subpulchrella TaxID=1486046 RepID=UPI0018A15793|nr:serine protease grass isoform X1 [Drosophila subpulchrella]
MQSANIYIQEFLDKVLPGITTYLLVCSRRFNRNVLGFAVRIPPFRKSAINCTFSGAKLRIYVPGGPEKRRPSSAHIRESLDGLFARLREVCVWRLANKLSTVRLGEFDSLTSLDCSGSDCIPPSEEFEINLAIRHSDYSRTNRYHDIGLLRLAKSVEYKVHIKPICLITNTALQPRIERLQRLVATGWGSSSSGSPSHTLKSIRVTRVDRSECRRRYLVNCRRDQICVSHESGESCSGDSGGPMGHAFRYDGQVVFIQVGIVSYGNPECHSPSVFTDVMRHVAWIKWVVDRHTE